jgi:hypothetical protein
MQHADSLALVHGMPKSLKVEMSKSIALKSSRNRSLMENIFYPPVISIFLPKILLWDTSN